MRQRKREKKRERETKKEREKKREREKERRHHQPEGGEERWEPPHSTALALTPSSNL